MSSKTCFKTPRGTCIDLICTNSIDLIRRKGTVEPGLSDFHLLIYFMLRTKYTKVPPKVTKYRNYKFFDKDYFLYELNHCLMHNNLENYSEFENVFTNILHRHAPLKAKLISLLANNKPRMSKTLRKAIKKGQSLKPWRIKQNILRTWRIISDNEIWSSE